MPRQSVLIRRLVFCAAAGFFAFICWIIWLADTGRSSIFFDLVKMLPYGDKLGHFCLFGLLTLGSNAALQFRKVRFGRMAALLGSLLVLCFVLLEELSQHFFPRCTLDLLDLLADGAGIALFTWLSLLLERKIRARNSAAAAHLLVSP
ncbi:MAG: VanZ family protein [Candidatus Electronema sp. V4]|uniref:VanZ family protein n=1 Tax=Candidatus Electronema sp. V4 TaxID=3454756 RepID=UPI00405599F5